MKYILMFVVVLLITIFMLVNFVWTFLWSFKIMKLDIKGEWIDIIEYMKGKR